MYFIYSLLDKYLKFSLIYFFLISLEICLSIVLCLVVKILILIVVILNDFV